MTPPLTGIGKALALLRQLSSDRGFAAAKGERTIGFLRAAALFRGCQRGRRLCATGYVRVRGARKMVIGDRVTFFGGMVPSEVICERDGRLEVGDESGFAYGVSVHAAGLVRIGRRCMLASFVRVSNAGEDDPAPIILGDDVWVAHGAIIAPGVTIGDGSVVSAGSVVTKNVPSHSLAIGNPARVIGLQVLSPRASSSSARPGVG